MIYLDKRRMLSPRASRRTHDFHSSLKVVCTRSAYDLQDFSALLAMVLSEKCMQASKYECGTSTTRYGRYPTKAIISVPLATGDLSMEDTGWVQHVNGHGSFSRC